MRLTLVVLAGLAGLLLGGPAVAALGVVLGHIAIRVRLFVRATSEAGNTPPSRYTPVPRAPPTRGNPTGLGRRPPPATLWRSLGA